MVAPGVWYRITAPVTQTYVARTSGSFPLRLTVFQGACGALSCVTANSSPEFSASARVAWSAVAGQDYYLLVHESEHTGQGFSLSITCAPTPANDECASAIPITVAVRWMAQGRVPPGVHPPETAFDPEAFVADLEGEGVTFSTVLS